MNESPNSTPTVALTPAPPITTLEQAAAYLEGLINHERSTSYTYARLDLRPIRALLDGLGHPERKLSVMHVAGSKGKGSTCLFAESILIALGEHVGTFTSPHLESWVERFRIDGKPIDAARLAEAVGRVRPVVEALRAGPVETLPSFFDATTAVAFLLFAEAGVDRALIEVGLGGRLDSTNVVAPVVTCITSIELEHTDKLGNTEAKIAAEKAGILKTGVPVVLGRLRSDAARVIYARAEEVGAPTSEFGTDFGPLGVKLAMPGEAARLNAALAVECVRALGVYETDVIDEAAVRGLASCRLPARIEVLASDPAVIVDAAHTFESARVLAEALVELAPEGFDLLLSVSRDKNLEALLEPLLPRARRVWATCADPIRSLGAALLAERVSAKAGSMGLSITLESDPDPARATIRARQALAPGGRLCATGSVYLAGLARRVLSAGESRDGSRERTRNAVGIGLALPGEVARIPEIERRAATLLSPDDLPPEIAARTSPVEVYALAQREGRLIVARDPEGKVLGFAHVLFLAGHAHLEELDVDPAFGRRGIGRRLVEAACGWAGRRGCNQITLSTFREVAWNAPFYARLGFSVMPIDSWTEAQRALREKERCDGLDVDRRVIMTRPIVAADLEYFEY